MSGWVAAAQAGADLAGSAINLFGTQMNNRAQQRMADRQNAYDLEMWNKTNLYNSPTETMKRLEAAGLNPNLVYGSGNVTSQASPAPRAHDYSYTAPLLAMKLPDMLNVLSQYADYQQKTAQVDVTKQQLAVNDATIALNKAKLLTEDERKRLTSNLSSKAFYEAAMANERGWYQTDFLDQELRRKIADNDTKEYYLKNILPYRSSLLSSEARMNENLRDWNLTSANAVWAKILALFLDKFGVSKTLLNPKK